MPTSEIVFIVQLEDSGESMKSVRAATAEGAAKIFADEETCETGDVLLVSPPPEIVKFRVAARTIREVVQMAAK